MLQYNKVILFLMVYSAYSVCYFLRMPFGVIKNDLLKIYPISVKYLGYVDLSFLLPYAVVSLTMGDAVNYLGPHSTLSLSLCISAVAFFLLPFCKSFSSFIVSTFFVGAFQALCWPSACCILSSSFKNYNSSIFGLFGTSCFIGGIVGKILSIYLNSHFSWVSVFVIPSSLVTGTSIIIFLMGFYYLPNRSDHQTTFVESPKSISVFQLLSLPGVFDISLTMFFVKCVRYTFMFWLPLFLMKALNYSTNTAGYMSLSFDIGGIFGSILIGFVCDSLCKGWDMFVCALSLSGMTLFLILFWFSPNTKYGVHIALLLWAGGLNGGSDVLLCGSVAVKLSKKYENYASVSLLTGLINGMGSLGTIAEGPLISYVSEWFGWHALLPLIIVLSLISVIFGIKGHFALMVKNVRQPHAIV